ncbi:LuxR family transcriptional regulator [Asticcacaulis sp. AND118]|uniref:helix-turn-helix transcriptional regulator n=1 Tax=Asticcacaulis sp. AND118 TaxID=2840468 RepID=UPI001CFFA06F|nr:LuxR family transcriptional regulator [Asticcacaulis sp. AND118]UDF05681.1 LuxR C-terminal-related transcriptional regulator [Asticcacaulis sp. AND118]
MPSYVRSRLLAAREFALDELSVLRESDPAFDGAIIETIRAFAPFDAYCFSGVDLDGCRAGSGILLSTDMPLDMLATYSREGFIQTDPLIAALTSEAPDAAWDELPDTVTGTPAARRLSQLMETYLLPPRLVFSFWNEQGELYGAATFARARPFSAAERQLLKWVASRLHAAMQAPVLTRFNAQIGLTDKELACLELASRGHSSSEIASRLALSAETVDTYFKSLSRKMQVRNRTQAVADALRIGLIH